MTQSDAFFSPRSVHDHFIAITQRAHPSANQKGVTGNEDPVREYVVSRALEIPNVKVVFYEKDATDPGKRVIVLSRAGSGNYAGKSPVILQAHMDMVYNPVDMAFPLDVIVNPTPSGDGVWIKAKENKGRDCTLGADDGIGVATVLAILGDNKLNDYPLECLFTVREETDMGGAQNFDLTCLSGRQLINIDAEELTVIIYGSAGGGSTQYRGNITRVSRPLGYSTIQLSVSGLKGGHSGVDINKGRLNAIKVLVQALARLDKRITSLDISGGGIGVYDLLLQEIRRRDVDKSNAIPAAAQAIVVLPTEESDQFITDFTAFCAALKSQNLPEENSFSFSAKKAHDTAQDVLDQKSTDALLHMLQQIPHGVIAMIPDVPGVVETSTNLHDVFIDGTGVTIGSSNRGSREASLTALNNLQTNIGTIFQFDVITGIDSYPSWRPNPNSPLLKIAEAVYGDPRMYGDQCKVTVIHAGLECGTISARYAEVGIGMDCISIGPTIKDPHTPNESLRIKALDGTGTVQRFYDAASQILQKVFTA